MISILIKPNQLEGVVVVKFVLEKHLKDGETKIRIIHRHIVAIIIGKIKFVGGYVINVKISEKPKFAEQQNIEKNFQKKEELNGWLKMQFVQGS